MNTEWARGELQNFLDLLAYTEEPGLYRAEYAGSDDEIASQKVVVEKIWLKVLGPKPVHPISSDDPLRSDRDWALRCVELIRRDAELRENLGEDAPDLNASKLHPWVWEGASSLWQSGHFGEAVGAAVRKVNAETQNKVGRRDVSETDLVVQAFSDDAPALGRPRLRLPGQDDGKTAKSMRRGVRSFADGFFAAIRNPLAHDGGEIDETAALEQLAALSILARWIDLAELRVA